MQPDADGRELLAWQELTDDGCKLAAHGLHGTVPERCVTTPIDPVYPPRGLGPKLTLVLTK